MSFALKPGTGESTEQCDTCRRTFEELSTLIQQAHDAQQARWARESRVDHVIEYGMATAVRCRVY